MADPWKRFSRKHRPTTAHPTKLRSGRQIGQSLLLGDEERVLIAVERDNDTLDVTERRLPRDSLNVRQMYRHDRDGDTFQLLSDDIAYLKLSNVDNKRRRPSYVNAAAGTKGLIIDIRNYPSSFMVFALGQHLVVGEKRSSPGLPGAICQLRGRFDSRIRSRSSRKSHSTGGKLSSSWMTATVSQSEYTTMAFRAAPNTRLSSAARLREPMAICLESRSRVSTGPG